VKYFSFSIFYDQSELCKKIRNNIVTTEKVCIWNGKRFMLRDEETISKANMLVERFLTHPE